MSAVRDLASAPRALACRTASSTASSPGSTSTRACWRWRRTTSAPLLERAKFLAIFASNLDEFYQVRVAGLKQQVAAGIRTRSADGLTPHGAARRRSRPRSCRSPSGTRGSSPSSVMPALQRGGRARSCAGPSSTAPQREELNAMFREQIFPVLTPLAVDSGRPFPYISNLSLNLAVLVRDPTARAACTSPASRCRRCCRASCRSRRGPLLRPARGGDRRQPRPALPRHGDRRAPHLPRHAQRRPRDRRRRRRPARGARGGAAAGAASARRCGSRSSRRCPSTCSSC